jgi:hypothetical protein
LILIPLMLSEKLARGEYNWQFNPPTTPPIVAAGAVECVLRHEWANAMRGRLTLAEKRHLVAFLEKLRNENE